MQSTNSSDRESRLKQLKNKMSTLRVGETSGTVNKTSNSRYDDLDDVRVTLTNAPKVWDDKDLATIKTYDVSQMSPTDIMIHGKAVFERIEGDKFSTSDVDIILALAVSILEPGCSMETPIYILEPPMDKIGNKFKTINVEASESRADENLERARQLERMRGKHSRAKTEADKRRLESILKRLENTISSSDPNEESEDAKLDITNEDEVFMYPYLAAYLLRLYGKTPEAWCDKFDLAKKRAATWYNVTGGIVENVLISAKQATFIREAMARKPEICSTWVLWGAYTENNPEKLSSTSAGMLKYLSTQMYSYTGMHAYSFVIQIQSETGVSFKTLLTELDCPATRVAVREIAGIIRKYEITAAHPNRTSYFRFARVWDPGYFSSVQTTNCKMLAYVVAQVRKSISGGMNSPTDIFALKGLDEKLIADLDVVAGNLYEIIMASTTQDEESGSIWKRNK
ncbi:TPA_asm: nucleocapsid [Bacopa monnieri virus 1]|uniref:Nucleoprotein n=1 Tax=Bacopa monnieri virus 1 TaxID=2813287 RepID=A0AAD2KPP7_9RHAB|nr:nucleocapsid [Bacopa monnieri virus 1]DAF42441.1 TPA_asm: nucleocapsid [Bacopa monnieri virus 1]